MARLDKYVRPIGPLLAILCVAPMVARAQCLGDSNGDGMVTVDEIIKTVNNALDGCQISGQRFVDNGDGTISDRVTGLMWEQKDGGNGSINLADPHDADNRYTWSASGSAADGTAYTDFLSELNNGASTDGGVSTAITGCFAGHCDWRLPTIVELQGILNQDFPQGACVAPCLLWSATTDGVHADQAWSTVRESVGGKNVIRADKDGSYYVRAVRANPPGSPTAPPTPEMNVAGTYLIDCAWVSVSESACSLVEACALKSNLAAGCEYRVSESGSGVEVRDCNGNVFLGRVTANGWIEAARNAEVVNEFCTTDGTVALTILPSEEVEITPGLEFPRSGGELRQVGTCPGHDECAVVPGLRWRRADGGPEIPCSPAATDDPCSQSCGLYCGPGGDTQ